MALPPLPDHLVQLVLTPYLDVVSLVNLAATHRGARELFSDDIAAIRTFLTQFVCNQAAARTMSIPSWTTFVGDVVALMTAPRGTDDDTTSTPSAVTSYRQFQVEVLDSKRERFHSAFGVDDVEWRKPNEKNENLPKENQYYVISPFLPRKSVPDTVCVNILRCLFPHVPHQTPEIAVYLKVSAMVHHYGFLAAKGAIALLLADGSIVTAVVDVMQFPPRRQGSYLRCTTVAEFRERYPRWCEWLQEPSPPFFQSRLTGVNCSYLMDGIPVGESISKPPTFENIRELERNVDLLRIEPT
eukprot:PhF_6_TR8612/c0_g1_i1/m.13428